MQKNSIARTRTSQEVKQECDFDVALPEKEDLVSFAENVSSVGSNNPSQKAKEIMRLYADGIIDFETAEFEIMKLHS